MFKPNIVCKIYRSSGQTDVYGQPKPSTIVMERCSIIDLNMKSLKTTVRADSSASRGAASEEILDALLLMTKTTKAQIEDVVEVAGVKIRITKKFPRHDIGGKLNHYEVGGMIWSEE